MEFYEVVIVGAGPAGLACAQKLGEAGKKVLLLEKNKTIGPKVCAGGLRGKDLQDFKIPGELLDCQFSRINIFTSLQKRLISIDRTSVYTVDRKNLGQWLLGRINKANVAVRTNAKVIKIDKDNLLVNNSEKIGFRYLVGADGSASVVRACLGLNIKDIIIAMQYIIPIKKYNQLEFFFDSRLFGFGYAWIFPHKDYVSIGCGCDSRVMPAEKLRQSFCFWLKRNKVDVSEGEFQASPINFDYQGYKFGNIFLAGDAAGFISGLTGEGIYQALVSGEEIAKMVIDANYVSGRMEEIIKKKKAQNRIFYLLKNSRQILGLEFELLAFLMKSKQFSNKMIDFLL